MESLRFFWKVLKETYAQWTADKVPRLGASLAYYSIFSLAPILLIVISIAGMVFQQKAEQEILNEIGGTLGPDSAKAVEVMVHSLHVSQGAIWATVVGVIVLFFGATGLFVELQDALNTIWKVAPKPNLGWWEYFRTRLLSLTVVLGTGFLLLASLIVSAVLTALSAWLTPEQGQASAWFWDVVNILASLAIITLLFAMIYRILPDVEVAWKDVWLGAAVTAVLFTLGKYAISVYLVQGGVAGAFGAAGSVIVILVWVYYSAQLLLFGAEFTYVYARMTGSPMKPTALAVPAPGSAAPSPTTPAGRGGTAVKV